MKKTFKRRRPGNSVSTADVVVEMGECPSCPHKAEEHNQFGCCFTEEACYCLMTPASIAAAKEIHEEGIPVTQHVELQVSSA